MTKWRAATTATAALVAGCLVFGACGLLESDDDAAKAVADALAESLESGSFSDAPVAGTSSQVQRRWDDTVGNLRDVDRTVESSGLEKKSDGRVATMNWAWQIGDQKWTYSTRASLIKVDGAWRAEFDPAVVEPSLQAGDELRLSRVASTRGDILAGDGTPIVTERPVRRFGIDKTKVAQPKESAEHLGRLLGIDSQRFAARVEKAGPQAFVEGLTLRADDVPAAVAAYEIDPRSGRTRRRSPVGPIVDVRAVDSWRGRTRDGRGAESLTWRLQRW